MQNDQIRWRDKILKLFHYDSLDARSPRTERIVVDLKPGQALLIVENPNNKFTIKA